MIILSIDIGSTCGIAISTSLGIEYAKEYKFTSLKNLLRDMRELVDTWRPDMVLAPIPTRRYETIFKHGKMLGIIKLICEMKDIIYIQVVDSHCKKVVIGKGDAKKEDIERHYPEYNSGHIRDAVMFIDAYAKDLQIRALGLPGKEALATYTSKRGWNDSYKKLFELIDK